jgi:fructan beta-fructosidase
MRNLIYVVLILIVSFSCKSNEPTTEPQLADTVKMFSEAFRSQLHFSPKENWMNDPNGMVYYKGEYHLFYQHYPQGMVWGPMHWGHAVSEDLVHWTHLPIALYPDSLGLIFSGSAVVDENNTSGLGSKENPALVAIFTYHSMEKEKAGRTDYQSQGMAYSIDSGKTWIKYEKNPVIKNQGIKDFRDPKVFWHTETKKWVMILAVSDHVELWGSPDLKAWDKLSEFGSDYGAHGGVWECPDMFKSKIEGESSSKWLMVVSLNPGAPNGGSGTQYFVGDFDGKKFTTDTDKKTTTWLDYGPDNYAGVTWFNAPEGRNIFLGWMSNWAYAQDVPTNPWRSANTIPRDIVLKRIGGRIYATSTISPEVSSIVTETITFGDIVVRDSIDLTEANNIDFSKSIVTGSFQAKDFTIELSNAKGQKLLIGFDVDRNRFFINRGKSGNNNFSKNFNADLFAARISTEPGINLTCIADASSLEIFFDDGLSVMTTLFFPDEPLSHMQIKSDELKVEKLQVKQLESIWK